MSGSSTLSGLLAIFILLLAVAGFLFGGCAPHYPVYKAPGKKVPATQRPYRINGKTYYPIESSRGYREKGTASWYGDQFHGRKTACGEMYDMHDKTAAHKILPMGTIVLVRNLENGRETVVRINDRGPFTRGRIIDLSYAAANELGMLRNGVASAEIIALGEAINAGDTNERLRYQDFDRGSFYIQIGSFLNKNNAINLASRLSGQGMQTTIQPFFDESRTYHRVQVYAGSSLTQARQLEQRFLEGGFPGSFVIAR